MDLAAGSAILEAVELFSVPALKAIPGTVPLTRPWTVWGLSYLHADLTIGVGLLLWVSGWYWLHDALLCLPCVWSHDGRLCLACVCACFVSYLYSFDGPGVHWLLDIGL